MKDKLQCNGKLATITYKWGMVITMNSSSDDQ